MRTATGDRQASLNPSAGAPALAAGDAAQTRWPLGLRVLFVLCCLAIVLGGVQMVSVLTVARHWAGTSWLQPVYWVTTWVLTVAAVAVGALGMRRTFGVLCLAGAALHVTVSGYFNFQIAGAVGPNPLTGHLRVWYAWDPATTVYLWNCLSIGFNAAVCHYLLRYEWPRWRECEAPRTAGFEVAVRGTRGG